MEMSSVEPSEAVQQQPQPTVRHIQQGQADDAPTAGELCCRCCSIFWLIIGLPFSLICALKVIQEYERAVLFRVGYVYCLTCPFSQLSFFLFHSRVRGGALGPGIITVMPCIDQIRVIDMRMQTYNVPPQEVLTKDSVTVYVDAVVYYKVEDANIAAVKVENYANSTQLVAMTTLRTVFGTKNLAEILSDREHISEVTGRMLDDATEPWGIKVERVEIKDVRLPQGMQRAMAAEAEAAREARAKVIAAEGEQKASRALKEASDIISESPAAMQLRYLQTLNSIAAEKNSTILFPIPIEMLKGFGKSE